MTNLKRKEMMQLNPKTKMVFGTSAKHEGYLVLFSALDFRNLILPKGWKIQQINILLMVHAVHIQYL